MKTLSLRATPKKVIFTDPAEAVLSSHSEGQDLHLSVTSDQAEELDWLLGQEIDIYAIGEHTEFGFRGELESYCLLSQVDPEKAWKDWFEANCSDWNNKDIEKELGRK